MLDESDLRRARISIDEGAPLSTLTRVLQCVAVTGESYRGGRQTDRNTRFVHHQEHVRKPLMQCTDQFADTFLAVTES